MRGSPPAKEMLGEVPCMEQTVWLIGLLDQLKGDKYHHLQEELTTFLLLADDSIIATFNDTHIDTLCRHIVRDKQPMQGYAAYIKRQAEFVLATLQVLQYCGNAQVLPTLATLANYHLDTRIPNAALLCQNKILERSVNAKMSETLLRPAHSTGTAPDELLRAASPSASQTPADELPRGSENPE